ncbi:MAG: tetratricopeptide repeat protein [Flavobacteriales bacterium]|nr:tetratricopeptide repeat protein [Flavobacteriales bacterium]
MKKSIAGLILVCLTGIASAQSFKVETVKGHFEFPAAEGSDEFYENLDKDVELIDAAATHPKTANDPKMWYYRGLTYLTIYLQGTEVQRSKHPNSLNIATEALYKCIDTDVKKKYTEKAEAGLLNCAIGHYNNGVAQYKNAEYTEAIESYKKVLKIIPLDKDGNLKRNNIVKETLIQYSSYAAVSNEDYATAKKYLNELIDMNFMDPNIYIEMVRIYLIEKDTNTALEYVTKGRDMFETNTTLIDVELDLYLKMGRSKELIDKLNAAIERDAENKIYYFARAVSNMKLENLQAAEDDYKKVIELDPGFADAYYNLGVVYVDRCKPIAKKIDESRDFKEQNRLATEIDGWYKKAAIQFEEAMAVGSYADAEKLELAQTMKKLYGRLMQNDASYKAKYEDMKALIATLE